jgi:hypothetical protein
MKTSEIGKWYRDQLNKGLSDEQIEKEFDELIKSKEK